MAINDFSTLICMVATMSIAFVATEYVTSYTKNLCERFFKFQEFVKASFQECRDLLTDMETLNHIPAIDVGGKSTNGQIEAVKRKNESLKKEIDEVETIKNEAVTDICQARSMSALCLFVFLFNVALLFLGGIECCFSDLSRRVCAILCIFSILYVVLGWMLGERENPKKLLNFSSLCHATYSFVSIFVVSVIIGIINFQYLCYVTDFWWWLLLFCTFISYLNFVVFILKVNSKAKEYKKDVVESKNGMIQKCTEAEKDVEDLLSTTRLSEKLNASPLEA